MSASPDTVPCRHVEDTGGLQQPPRPCPELISSWACSPPAPKPSLSAGMGFSLTPCCKEQHEAGRELQIPCGHKPLLLPVPAK